MTLVASTKKHYLIIGLGLTGLSCARFCQKKHLSFSLCDTRTELPGVESIRAEFPAAELFLGLPDLETLTQYDELLVSPGISINTQQFRDAEQAGVTLSGDIQLFSEYAKKPIIAITGSNGKSTVTTLVADLLNATGKRAVAGGNIGTPALDLLADEDQIDVYVMELSSFQLETTRDLGADVATILNISPDHMDRYDGMADYERAKQRIFQQAKNIVVNSDDDHTRPALNALIRTTNFSLSAPVSDADFGVIVKDGSEWLAKGETLLFPVASLKIRGAHNAANALAAFALIDALGVPLTDTDQALASFTGLAHRCQWVASIDDVDYFNDSKGTNVGSTLAAITGLGAQCAGRIWLIAGGEGKGQDFSELAESCNESGVAEVLTFGADRDAIKKDIENEVAVSCWNTIDEAIVSAKAKATAGDVVLFSPACASFDQFRNYVHRGEYFCQCVEGLK